MKHILTSLLLLCATANADLADVLVKRGSAPPEICTEKTYQPVFGSGIKASRITFQTSKLWPQKAILRVRFLDGSKNQQDELWKRFQAIDALVNLTFTKATSTQAEIKVTFKRRYEHWSYIGKDSKSFSPSMSIGLRAGFFGDLKEEWDRVGIHEILHSIGAVHEHQNPIGGIQWNEPVVYDYYWRTQHWDRTQTYQNVIYKYSVNQIRGSAFDPKSIMLYPIDGSHTVNGFSVGWNNKLSDTDIDWLKKIYP